MSSDLSFSMTSWGSPSAPKRALLLHGLQGCGQVFFKVQEYLVKQGYRVDAPDLLGHGFAPRAPSGEKYTIPLLASHLASHLSEEKYDVIAGVSFGSTVVAPLLKQLKHKPARAVLVEPILDRPPFSHEKVAEITAGARVAPTEEEVAKAHPLWDAKECLIRRFCVIQLDVPLIADLFDEMRQGNLAHTLLPSAAELPSTELIILAGDPDIRSAYPAENAAILKEKYPHVKFGRRLGASHDMHKDKPDVVAAVILGGLAGDKEIEVLAGAV